jgi:hypothetical protein
LEGLALSGASVGVVLTCTFTLAPEPPDTVPLVEPEAVLLIVLVLAPAAPVALGFSVAAPVAAGFAVAVAVAAAVALGLTVAVAVAVAVAATGVAVAALVA